MVEVKLHGYWHSPFIFRVIWTLKLKGIPYEYIEEERFIKSPKLIQYNPVHKKVPVLVHDGKPICESMIIVEYLDELWPHNTLLPADPYEKAQARFWVRYVDDMVPSFSALFRSSGGEEQVKIIENLQDRLQVVENQCLGDEKKFFGGDTINILDIALGSLAKILEVFEDVFKVKILEAEKFPHLHSWFNNLMDVPIIKENTPDHDKHVAFMKPYREVVLASS